MGQRGIAGKVTVYTLPPTGHKENPLKKNSHFLVRVNLFKYAKWNDSHSFTVFTGRGINTEEEESTDLKMKTQLSLT